MITPKSSKIEEILNSSTKYEVPKYQRAYSWGKSEAVEFLEDLTSYAEANGGKKIRLFLGTMIFDTSSEDEKILKVVDGQQRITTIMLLLIACRNLAKKINDTRLAQEIQRLITFTNLTNAQEDGEKLMVSESIKNIFNEISKFEWNGDFPTKLGLKHIKRQVNRVKPIYDFFWDEISNYDSRQLSTFLDAIYNSYIVRIDIRDTVEAFSIFERTNARGMDLEASDLLKNFLFSKGVAGLEESWAQISDNADGNILRMLKYFYVSKHGYVSKADLYKRIREYGDVITAPVLVEELKDFAEYFAAIRMSDVNGIREYFEKIGHVTIAKDADKYEDLHVSLEGLRLFKVSQIYPLIYSAIECFKRAGGASDKTLSKKFISLIKALERYHFVNNAICERIGNEVEKPYADFCLKYAKSDKFAEITQELVGVLKNKLAHKDEFVSRFTDLSYSQDSIPLLSYIFDRTNNYSLAPGQRVRIYNSDQKVLRKNHNIEHFYPQKPEAEMKKDSHTQEVVDNIGNLLAISFRVNSKLGNISPEKKVAKLRGSLDKEIMNTPYVKDFLNKYGGNASAWNKKMIETRAKDLANESYDKIWKFE
ncbi:MAG: hypothetical protein CVU79_04200 [Elusimicrobia bacterium HGW-Elusimicrobia-3]|nr:MAG: hypothetical protein CVU79_04200 [Elusimicrobia bacterium HGW-Elusimicrobia-3]